MQAVLRLQARARAERVQVSESSQSSSMSSHFNHPVSIQIEHSKKLASRVIGICGSLRSSSIYLFH